jgi:hypothetical protein
MSDNKQLKTLCVACGFGVEVDDEGYCVECGNDALGEGANMAWAYKNLYEHIKEEVEKSNREIDRCQQEIDRLKEEN